VPQLANANAGVVIDRLRAWKSESVTQVIEYRGETTIVVPHRLMLATAGQCKTDPELNFNQLSDATCVDRFPNEPRFELNYQLFLTCSAYDSKAIRICGASYCLTSLKERRCVEIFRWRASARFRLAD
jgi:NADH:ubiquinone oxidoreductase subunit C